MSVWRTIPGFAGYAINEDGDLVNNSGYMLTRVGRKKDHYWLKKRNGATVWARIATLMQSAMAKGRIVPAPIEEATAQDTEPDGFVPIPDYSPYYIDRQGSVWNSTSKHHLKWKAHLRAKSPCVMLCNREKAINMLLEITFGKGAAEAAGLPPWHSREQKSEDIGEHRFTDKYDDPKPKRRCHDCGTPTNDYRCKNCRDKWKRKNRVTAGYENGDDIESL